MTSSKVEFLVENIKDREKLKSLLLNTDGITKVEILKNDVVLLETELPCSIVGNILQDLSGRRSVLQGYGVGGTAVSMIEGKDTRGVVRISGTTQENGSLVDGTIDGLPFGEHFLNVHVAGDISQGCDSLGPVYEPIGALGKINVNSEGRADFKFIVPKLKVQEILGRSLAITTLNEEKRIACGIIARSAGLFENSKKICACDGVTLWDERNVPIAGHGRRNIHDGSGDHHDAKL